MNHNFQATIAIANNQSTYFEVLTLKSNERRKKKQLQYSGFRFFVPGIADIRVDYIVHRSIKN